MRVTLAFFQWLFKDYGEWPCNNVSCLLTALKTLPSMSSNSSLGCILSGPIDLRDQAPVAVYIPADGGSVFAETWIFVPRVWGPAVVVKTEKMKALTTFSALLVTTSTPTGKNQAGSALLKKLPVPCRALCSSLFCSWLWKPTCTTLSSTQPQNGTLPQLQWQLWINIIKYSGKTCHTIMCRR